MVDIFDRIHKDSGGPIGQYLEKAFGYYMYPRLEGELGPHMVFNGIPAVTLAKPVNVNVRETDRKPYSLRLNWEDVADAQAYEIEFNGMNYFDIHGHEFLFEDLKPKTQYSFKVRSAAPQVLQFIERVDRMHVYKQFKRHGFLAILCMPACFGIKVK